MSTIAEPMNLCVNHSRQLRALVRGEFSDEWLNRIITNHMDKLGCTTVYRQIGRPTRDGKE